jgi:hypothetical protein
LPLPENPFPCEDREETTVRRWPYVSFDLNDYSVPSAYVRRAVVVYATLDCVRIVEATTVSATHARSYDKGEQIEQSEHVAELVACKRAARHHRGLDRLHHACAHTAAFFAAVATRQGNLGAATTGLITLLDCYGASALDAALDNALHASRFGVTYRTDRGGTFEKSGPSPSTIVGCARMALRSAEYGRSASIAICTVGSRASSSRLSRARCDRVQPRAGTAVHSAERPLGPALDAGRGLRLCSRRREWP